MDLEEALYITHHRFDVPDGEYQKAKRTVDHKIEQLVARLETIHGDEVPATTTAVANGVPRNALIEQAG